MQYNKRIYERRSSKIKVFDIKDFPEHPFKINNDLNYEELKDSILDNGILVPAIVRK